ncbi:uncharacterized protein LOC134289083 [Aedes albopictus]|uniref:PHD-type domain-containing protein n=1 Tax=Aedes albopictus TaxID=7160 RepID=A0ABM2A7X7_AEDAL
MMSGKSSKTGSGKNSSAGTFNNHREGGTSVTGAAAVIPTRVTVPTTAASSPGNISIVAASAAAVATSEAMGITNLGVGALRTAAVAVNSSTDLVKAGNPPPTTQVNADVANKLSSKGAIPKQTALIAEQGKRASLSNLRGKVVVRRNPFRRARPNRYRSCELCADSDNSRMVQCDGCERWFHFTCVEVTEGIAEISWVCPVCPAAQYETEQLIPPKDVRAVLQADNPPPMDNGETKSCGKKSSKRSEKRKLDLRLQKLEEQKKLEQKFLEEKFKILEECEGDSETDFDDEDLEKMSNISQWIRDTEGGEAVQDSGVVEEDLQEEDRHPSVPTEQSVLVEQRQPGQPHFSQGGQRNTFHIRGFFFITEQVWAEGSPISMKISPELEVVDI